MSSEYPKEFLDYLQSITSKRPKTVIDHILKYGHITSQELSDVYGYNHPPRAVRDVRELGIPVETYRIIGTDGRSIAAYRFGDPSQLKNNISKLSGRTVLSKALKQALIRKFGSRCSVYYEIMDESELQIDHRVPYEIAGEGDSKDINQYMLLSPSANRAKSWTCEHCPNWTIRDCNFCVTCFWAHPENYTHIADKKEKIISVVFSGKEVADYENLIAITGVENAQKTIKNLIKDYIR